MGELEEKMRKTKKSQGFLELMIITLIILIQELIMALKLHLRCRKLVVLCCIYTIIIDFDKSDL